MAEKRGDNTALFVVAFVAVMIAVVMIILAFLNDEKSNDITISGGGEAVSLKCENSTLTHPVLTDYKPLSFVNQITANFQDDKLTSIMYQYEGVYKSAEEVDEAEAFAAADYNIILAKDYGVDADIFSHVFMKDGNKLKLTINSRADKVSPQVAPYFMLGQNRAFPKSLDAMKKEYENNEFSCKTTNNDEKDNK